MEDRLHCNSTADADNHGTHADDSRRWVYVPDATISNSLVTGTKGFLDIKGIYYQSGDYATGGVVFFDDTGLQRSTNAVAAPVITSKQDSDCYYQEYFSIIRCKYYCFNW